MNQVVRADSQSSWNKRTVTGRKSKLVRWQRRRRRRPCLCVVFSLKLLLFASRCLCGLCLIAILILQQKEQRRSFSSLGEEGKGRKLEMVGGGGVWRPVVAAIIIIITAIVYLRPGWNKERYEYHRWIISWWFRAISAGSFFKILTDIRTDGRTYRHTDGLTLL